MSAEDIANLRRQAEDLQQLMVKMATEYQTNSRLVSEELARISSEIDRVLAKLPAPKDEEPGLFQEEGA